ncbi:MAG: hypothetical protein OXC30_01105 [Alphaproteobacteria bacterium]|nr:hypothetical protein [Alphaproteobacteria bacterium]
MKSLMIICVLTVFHAKSAEVLRLDDKDRANIGKKGMVSTVLSDEILLQEPRERLTQLGDKDTRFSKTIERVVRTHVVQMQEEVCVLMDWLGEVVIQAPRERLDQCTSIANPLRHVSQMQEEICCLVGWLNEVLCPGAKRTHSTIGRRR